MRAYKFIPLVLTCLLYIGCGRAPQPAQSGLEQTISKAAVLPRDDLGREIKLETVPRRVVTIGPGATETIFALGAGDRLVGRDSGSDYPTAALKVPVVGNFTGPFLEKTAAVRPDLIIVQGETYDKTRADLWQQKCGAPVAVLSATSVAELTQGIEKTSKWLGVVVPKSLSAQFQPMEHRSSLRVFWEVSRSPLWTAGQGTLIDDVMQKAGVSNVAQKIQGYKQYNLETLMAQNPDAYVVSEKKPDKGRVLKELRAHPALRNLECVKAGRVIVLPADLLLRPGPRLGVGISMLRDAATAIKTARPTPSVRGESSMNKKGLMSIIVGITIVIIIALLIGVKHQQKVEQMKHLGETMNYVK